MKGLVIGAVLLLLTGCGLFGDADAEAASAAIEVDAQTVRVEFGGRWFEINTAVLEFDAEGEPTGDTISDLEARIRNLGVERIEAVDARIEFDGSQFGVIDGVDGQEADTVTLANSLRTAATTGTSAVQVPFRPFAAAGSTVDAQTFADGLNRSIENDLSLSVLTENGTIPGGVIGRATVVERSNDGWQVNVRWNELSSIVQSIFPGEFRPGGEASFTVAESEDEDEPGAVTIVPGRPAIVCCDAESADRIDLALKAGVPEARLVARRADGERGTQWAEGLGVIEPVGSFTTRYTAGQNRVINIRRIAELTQGVILEPGETFSLNEFVGRRTEEKGFVPAGTIVNGHLVDSVGGGISQFATTIFNAAFFAGMDFETYQSHSIYFSRYPYGREATISWPAPNLVIHNPSPHGLLIWPTSTETSVTVDMYSTKWVDVEQTGQVERQIQVACTRVTTERTRTFVEDGHEELDTVFATYRPEGIACDGTETENPNDEQVEKLENGEDPNFANGGEPPGDGVPPEEQPPTTGPPAEDPPAEDPPPEDPPAEDPPPEDPPPEDPPPEDPPPDA